MPEDLMRYDLLTQQALIGVVRTALEHVCRDGLPGDHHFYITFDTNHPGARLSDRLKQKYPEEMTVVLQHQFWGLDVRADGFNVELSFDNSPEKLEVPFASIRGFFDPHVQFGLQFELEEDAGNVSAEEGGETTKIAVVGKDAVPTGAKGGKGKAAGETDGTVDVFPGAEESAPESPEKNSPDEPDSAKIQEIGKTKVINLDSFRKS